MQEIFLGEVIRQKRLELGLTQEQVCEGICDPITISRIENGKQTPNRTRINAILERLDLPADRYWAMLSKNELEVEALQKKVVAYNVQFERARGDERITIRDAALEVHKQLEIAAEKNDTVSRQLILRSRVLLGKEDGRYSFKEQQAMLLEAIRLTVPSFDLDEIGSNLYTTEEIKTINQLAMIHGWAGEHMEAIGILSQLYKYIRKHFLNIPLTQAHLNMVAFNYARELDVVGQYEKAIQIAEEGRRICLEFGHYLHLPGLLAIMAEAYHFLGEDEKSKDFYRQSYYLYKAVGDKSNRAIIQAEAQKYFDLRFDS